MPTNDIKSCLDYLFDDGEVFEVCLLGVNINKHALWDNEFAGKQIIAGWFDDKEKAIQIIQRAEKEVKPVAIYTTLNPCKNALLGRANNRLKVVKTRTTDIEIESISNILVDIDPKRPAGVSSSSEEIKKAANIANALYKELLNRGWPDCLCAESGNGYHLIFKAKKCTPEKIKGFLNGLSDRYSNEHVDIDTKVFNPARLVKIYGTTARKGENLPDRPHRLSKIKVAPSLPQAVSPELLEPFIQEETKQTYKEDKINVPEYLSKYGIEMIGEKQHGSSVLYLLQNCVFDESHSGKEAAIGQCSDGKLFYQCFHNSCQQRKWNEARQIISGNDKIGVVSNVSNVSNESVCKPSVSILSASCKQEINSENLMGEIRDWVLKRHGIFTTYDIDREFDLRTRAEKNLRSRALNYLKTQQLIEPDGVVRGKWRTVDNELEVMDVFSASSESVSIPFPLGISNLVKLYPKSIILIAGEANAGKSAYVSSLIYNIYSFSSYKDIYKKIGNETVEQFETWYFNSEASAEELKDRWSKYPDMNVFKNIKVVSRSSNFHDVIKPNAINVIDYMEIYDSFWEIGGWIKKVYEKLDKGIAVICIQKKSGGDIGRGGEITMEKPRLYLSIKDNKPYGGICKIVKAKSFVDPTKNPNGMEIDFKLINGCEFIETSGWRHVKDDKERGRINAEYELSKMEDPNGYVFEFDLSNGEKVGIKRKTYDQWAKAYINLDLFQELKKVANDNWLKPDGWFFQLSGYLNKINGGVNKAAQ